MSRARALALAVAIVGALAGALAYRTDPARAVAGWLAVATAAWATGVGALATAMIAELSRARWFVAVERTYQAIVATLPVSTLAVVPALVLRGDPAIGARAILELGVPLVAGELALRISKAEARDGHARTDARRRIAGAGLPLIVLAVTFAAFDWIGALHGGWVSNALGLELFVGGVVSAAGLVALLVWVRRRHASEVRPVHVHALATTTFVAICVWMYFVFAPFLVCWMGDRPPTVEWYGPRVIGPWMPLAAAIVVARFAVPFVLLLMKPIKQSAPALGLVGVALLATQPLELAWMAVPSVAPARPSPSWADLGALAFVVALALVVAEARTRDAAPLRAGDPRLQGALDQEVE